MDISRFTRFGELLASLPLRAAFVAALVVVSSGIATPAHAQISSVSPGSRTIVAGNAVTVSVTTDLTNVSLASGSAPGVTVAKGGAAPTFRFTFTAFTSATPGTYGFTFTDGASTGSFTLTINALPVTTTTTAPPTTTTAPPTTTTTRPPPTTTVPPTTTTVPPTTTTVPPTTTTVPPTTTTVPPTTTTTVPPTTTSSTLVPAGIAAAGEGSGGSNDQRMLFGGVGAIAILLAGLALIAWRRGSQSGLAMPGLVVASRRRSERRRVARQPKTRGRSRLGTWWKMSGPLVSFREWKGGRNAAKSVRRQIEERQRLRDQTDRASED